MRTDHLVSSQHITINEKTFQSLPPDVQKIVQEAAQEAIAWGRGSSRRRRPTRSRRRWRPRVRASSRSNRAQFADKALAAVDQMEKDGAWSSGLWKKIRAIQ